MNIHLVVIDPQNDFMDIPGAALPVPGANEDMKRLAKLIDRIGHKLEDIHVTMDSHRPIDIAHPAWWVDQDGNHPNPFTLISANDIENGTWQPYNRAYAQYSLNYARELEAKGKYQILIWPPHCLIGRWGHNIQEELADALDRWSEKEFALVDYVTKGSNVKTEHYGAVEAEVPDPSDPTTSTNGEFLNILSEADIILFAGEASSHCVLETVNQTADNIGEEHIKKFYLLTDCMSPVAAAPGGPDFPAIAEDWLQKMEARGVHLTTSTEFLA